MPRFFIKSDAVGKDNTVTLCGEDASHVARSLRMSVGETLTVCDENGVERHCRIEEIRRDEVFLRVESEKMSESEPSVRVTLYQALTKGDKFESIIQKSVELGVYAVVPVLSSRCISRPDEKSAEKKRLRWNAIAEEAAKQSGRGIIPTVLPTVTFPEALSKVQEDDACFFCYEEEKRYDLKSFLCEKADEKINSLSFFIGPEGGISPEEAALARAVMPSVSLGKRILRTETAPLCVLSGIMLYTDNLK